MSSSPPKGAGLASNENTIISIASLNPAYKAGLAGSDLVKKNPCKCLTFHDSLINMPIEKMLKNEGEKGKNRDE